jgi:hypothetical protein
MRKTLVALVFEMIVDGPNPITALVQATAYGQKFTRDVGAVHGVIPRMTTLRA